MTIELNVPPTTVNAQPAPATAREHLVTVLGGLWMTVGLFMDGYFHQHLDGTEESFLTPWHAVFYAGFGATALWLWRLARRRAENGRPLLRSLPAGYEAAAVGLLLFAIGGAGDAVWHTAFGVERGIDALLSPTHLILFAGLVLLLTAPVRAVRAAPFSPPGPWVVVLSVTSATALTAFFLNFVWGLGTAAYLRRGYDSVTEVGEDQVIAAVASMLVTTAVLLGAARVALSRGRVPRGAFTVLFGTVALLVAVAFDEDAEGIVAAVAAGAVLDAALVVLPRRLGPWTLPVAFAASAGALWLAYVGLLSGLDGIAWHAELWLGAVVLNVIAAIAVGAAPAVDTAGGRV